MTEHHLTDMQMKLVHTIPADHEISRDELAEALHTSASAITRACKFLLNAQVIEKTSDHSYQNRQLGIFS